MERFMDLEVEALIYFGGLAALALVAWAGWAMHRAGHMTKQTRKRPSGR
jgi:hypothetical protein